jgi:cobalt-zinc-cadmium efflux system outer membrane protein
MQTCWMSALLALAGCAGALDRTSPHPSFPSSSTSEPDAPPRAAGALFTTEPLDRAALIRAVLAGNPGVAAMRAAWRAATAEVRAAGAFEDPRVTYEVAPLSIARDVAFGQRVQVSQKLAWPGKRALATQAATADAELARQDVRATALELAALASSLFDDYAWTEQALAVNDHHRTTIATMQQAAAAQLAAGRGTPGDAFATEVELGRMAQERLRLASERERVVARLNGLLHRAPDAVLPAPAPGDVAPALTEPPPLAALLARAAERPDTHAARAQIAGDTARVAAADRAFYPDVEVMASYDSMWDVAEHRWMVGLGVALPVQRGAREAAADAARARLAQASAQLARVRDDVAVEVFRARREVVESAQVVASFDAQLVPAARAQVDAALRGLAAGRNDVTAVITAERGAREIELDAYRARTELSKRLAALDKATGRLPGGGLP